MSVSRKCPAAEKNFEDVKALTAELAALNRMRGAIASLDTIIQNASALSDEGRSIDWDGLGFLTGALKDECFGGAVDRVIARLDSELELQSDERKFWRRRGQA